MCLWSVFFKYIVHELVLVWIQKNMHGEKVKNICCVWLKQINLLFYLNSVTQRHFLYKKCWQSFVSLMHRNALHVYKRCSLNRIAQMSMVFLVCVVSHDKWHVLAATLSCNLWNRRLNITITAARFLVSVFRIPSLLLLL